MASHINKEMYVLCKRIVNGVNKKRKHRVVGKTFKIVVPADAASVNNRVVDALPVELHLPAYRFCEPETKPEERLTHGERGINELNEAYLHHNFP